MSSRTKGREIALQVLYQSDTTGEDLLDSLKLYLSTFAQGVVDEDFVTGLVEGVGENCQAIDTIIEKASLHWRIDRMPPVDRGVLRLAVFELTHSPEVPTPVILNEAIELGKRFGTEESSSFINGILDRVAQEMER